MQDNNLITNAMIDIGVLPAPSYQQGPANNPLNQTGSYVSQNGVGYSPPFSGASQNAVNPSRTKLQLKSTTGPLGPTTGPLGPTTSHPSQNLVNPSSSSRLVSQNLVNPSSSASQTLSEQARQAKGDLEILAATGRTKDFLGKQFTLNDLEYLSEKEILKYHRIYQSALAVRVNDTFGKMAIKSYATLADWLLPIDNRETLYDDLRNDYILMNEIDRWTGWLSLRIGSWMAVASTSLITAGHCLQKAPQSMITQSMITQVSPEINESGDTGNTIEHSKC